MLNKDQDSHTCEDGSEDDSARFEFDGRLRLYESESEDDAIPTPNYESESEDDAVPTPNSVKNNLPNAYIVEDNQLFRHNSGEEFTTNEADIVPVVEPLSVTIVPATWKEKTIIKAFPVLTFGRALYIFYVIILISIIYMMSITLAKKEKGPTNFSDNQNWSNLDIGSSWPSFSPTAPPITWDRVGDAFMVGKSGGFVGGKDISLLDREGQFSLSYDGHLLAIAGHGRPRVYELKFDNTSNQPSYWSPVDTFLDFSKETYYTLNMSFDGMNLVIGQPISHNSRGSVEIYKFNKNGKWEKKGQTLFGIQQDDWFGGKVQVTSNGQRIAIHAVPRLDINKAYTKIFDFDGGNWILYKKFENVMELKEMATNGEKMMTARDEFVTIYELESFSYTQMEFKSIVHSISISDDGNVVAVGCADIREVFLYKFDIMNQTYIQHGSTFCMYRRYFGLRVYLSSDGRRLATSDRLFMQIFHLDDNDIHMMTEMHLDTYVHYSDATVVFSGDGNTCAVGFYCYTSNYNDSNISTFVAM